MVPGALRASPPAWTQVVKSNQIDVLSLAMLRDFQEVDHALKTRLARQFGSDVGECNRHNRIHLDVSLLHTVALADGNVWTHPDSDAAGDYALSDTVAQALREDHGKVYPDRETLKAFELPSASPLAGVHATLADSSRQAGFRVAATRARCRFPGSETKRTHPHFAASGRPENAISDEYARPSLMGAEDAPLRVKNGINVCFTR
jgi:hypothetical protein